MSYVRSKKFFCCLPVRFGVFVMTASGTLFGGASVALAVWLIILLSKREMLTGPSAIAVYITLGVSAIVTLVSLFGLIGVFTKRISFISLYVKAQWITTTVYLAACIFLIYTMYTKRSPDSIQTCVNAITKFANEHVGEGATLDKNATLEFCTGLPKSSRVPTIISVIVSWLIQLYGIFIVSQYRAQLHEESDGEFEAGGPSSGHLLGKTQTSAYAPVSTSGYPDVTPYGQSAGANSSYAFTEPTNAHGAKY